MASTIDNSEKARVQKENIFLFVPNLIGYTRIILASMSLYYMPIHPKTCVLLYCISCLLDAVDGNAARYFNQCSRFGAVLDMVTDRCTTACLLCFLSIQNPKWTILFQFLISLDFASHYMHMYSSMTEGSSSHKKIAEGGSWYLRLYYTNNVVLFLMCAGNELFFVLLYVLSVANIAQPLNVIWLAALSVSGVICFAKQFINVVQIVNASRVLAAMDQNDRIKQGLTKSK
ncbi:CDP-diacylglycerol--inositol 3-phosphatidyltransferase [Hesseltinella vesiculosa]|uniref:CDP-diacylglycerol--inositol 3-phosphatidyltransferase n=1 Tax=Hesseltinella vesiculosa TaxID=101127 RepID=A0A1X2GUU8_9FUNG|nr:CDP-diacylglycerol--inositol 3-phosphatidyltransferase [Hesseltinella vesiculosa]